jgi:hypothetical protein
MNEFALSARVYARRELIKGFAERGRDCYVRFR